MPPLGPVRTAALATLLAALAGAAGPLQDDLTRLLTEARRAREACDFSVHREVLGRAAHLDGLPAQKVEVQALLAELEWKVDGDDGAARRRLDRASELSAPFAAWRELGRMEAGGTHYAAARTAWRAAVRTSQSAEEQLEARLGFAAAGVAEASALRLTGAEGAIQDLHQGFRDVRALVARGEGGRAAAHLSLRAALILREGKAAAEGLRAYFAVSAGGEEWDLIDEPRAELDRTLAGWSGADARPEADLVRALAGARLFEEAALVAHDPRAQEDLRADPEVAAILAYERYLRDVRALATESFRLRAADESDRGRTKREFELLTARLDAELRGRPGARRAYGAAILAALQERYGLWIWTGSKAGTFDLHMGHSIADSGTADRNARTVVLDSMVASGFRSWCGAGGGESVEWTARDARVRVR